ncbi:hypothetical protein MUK42_03838 [Musa troglodytarum]|uniref:Uncharacterized protein n=1 Tax=Musa troglodytarum TaxID=320322 RepID=A0A9E7GC85_9LILI|nr:hypothetical protein MUK42_03838 [Musa troglodytarum]
MGIACSSAEPGLPKAVDHHCGLQWKCFGMELYSYPVFLQGVVVRTVNVGAGCIDGQPPPGEEVEAEGPRT